MSGFWRKASLLLVISLAGCGHAGRVSQLNRDTEALARLLKQQQELIKAGKGAAEVHEAVLKADPYLLSMSKVCGKDPEKIKPPPFTRLSDFFLQADEQPHGLAADCLFYGGLEKKFYAQLVFAAGKYYAGHGDRAKAESLLRGVAEEKERAHLAETEEARRLLASFDEWDGFSPGWKAYLLGDYPLALREYKSIDDPRAWYRVAIMYDNGEGIPADKVKAMQWYLRAATKGLAVAQYQMGIHYETGEGVEQSETDAEGWYRKAVAQDYPPAKSALLRNQMLRGQSKF